jgi:murein DD-endopeptidase MepM/ murein hydrolase activator NlpD
VRVRQQDGSYSWNFHLQNDGVHPEVGDRVQRGEPIALSGNTGRSGGPHLHYQVAGSPDNWGQTIPISFECVVPVTGDDVTSTNTNPNFL